MANVDADLRSLVALVPSAGHPGAAFVMRPETATYLGTLRATGGGANAYPDLGPAGGTLLKLPVLTSDACEFDDSPPSAFIGLVSPSQVLWHEGDATVNRSSQAGPIMNSDPEATSPIASMFQEHAIALKVMRRAAWHAKSGSGAFFTVAH